MISIVDTRGLASEPNNLRRQFNGLLGISVGSPLFTSRFVTEIARFGTQICKQFLIVLLDYPERWNWLLHRHKNQADAVEAAVRLGFDLKQRYCQSLSKAGLGQEVEVWSWLRLIEEDCYLRNLDLLKSAFATDTGFRGNVILQVYANIGRKICKAEKSLNRNLAGPELNDLAQYLIEEIAGLFYLYFDCGYNIDVYPGKNIQLIEDIYTGKFPRLHQSLGYDWSRRGWIEVGRPNTPAAQP